MIAIRRGALPVCKDLLLQGMIREFYNGNGAAQIFSEETTLRKEWPFIIDHAAIRCMDVNRRAEEFIKRGFVCKDEIVDFPDQGWWAKVFRKQGCPALFIDQQYESAKENILRKWVQQFGDQIIHHFAVQVSDIEQAVSALQKRGVAFSGPIIGSPGSRLRQIFTSAEVRNGAPYTVLELIERKDYDGFFPDQANSLMQSSTQVKKTPILG